MVRFCTRHSFTHVVRALAVCAVVLCGASAAWGETYYWLSTNTSGDWTTVGKWSTESATGTAASTYPGHDSNTGSDVVVFSSAADVTIDAAVTISKLTISGDAAVKLSGTITASSATVTAGTLTLGGNLTVSGALFNNGTIAAAGNTLSFGTYSGSSDKVTVAGGTITATGTGGTIASLTATTSAVINGGSTGLTITSYTGGTDVELTTTGVVTFGSDVSANALNLSGTTSFGAKNVTAAGTVTINSGCTVTGTGTFTVSGSWLNSGTFTNSGSSVVFTADATISGDNTWGNFTCTAGGKTLTFTAGTTQTVTAFTITGSSTSSRVTLCSTSPGNTWTIKVPVASASVSYAKVQDSVSTYASITPTSSVSGGKNMNWIFTESYTWTGTTSTEWALASNWTDSVGNIDTGYPGLSTGDTATIPYITATSNYPILGSALEITSLSIAGSASLTLSSTSNLKLDAASSPLTNAGTISYAGSGRIVNSSTTAINDVNNNGTVAYTGTSGGIITDYGTTDYANLVISGSGAFTQSTASAIVVSGTAEFDATVSGLASLAVTGMASISTSVTTSGTQTYTGAVTLKGNTVFTANSGTAPAMVIFGSTVKGTSGQALTIGASGTATNVSFSGAVGGSNYITTLTVYGTATLGSSCTSVATTGAQTYSGAVTLGTNTTFTAGTNLVTFSSTVKGTSSSGQSLTIGASGTATNASFGGIVGGSGYISTITVYGTTAFGSGCTAVTSTGAQTYGGDATIAANLLLVAGANTVSFGSTVKGTSGQSLTIGASGTATKASFGNTVGSSGYISAVTVYGSTTFGSSCASVTTTGNQTYTGNATVAAATTTFLANNSGTAGTVTFSGTLKGSSASREITIGSDYTVTTKQTNAVFGGTVGTSGSSKIGKLTVCGTTAINAAEVTTTDVQTYYGQVTAGADVTITANGGSAALVTFNGALISSASGRLVKIGSSSVNTNVAFNSTVGSAGKIKSLSVYGTTTINCATIINNATIRTTGDQVYSGTVTLSTDAVLVANSSNTAYLITFSGNASGAFALNIGSSSETSNAKFADKITISTASLYVSGTSVLGAASVTTTGIQTYTDSVTLSGSSGTSLSAGSTGVSFGSTVNSDATARALTVSGTTPVKFTGAVGGGSALASLTTGTGAATIDGGAVTTTGAQTYGGAITQSSLSDTAILTLSTTGTAGGITFTGTVLSGSTKKTLVLSCAGGTVSQAGAITVANLLLKGAGTFSLTTAANTVTTIAASSGTGALAFENGSTLIVGSVTDASSSKTNGITRAAEITLTTTGGDLTLNQPVASTGGNITLTPSANINLSYAGTVLSLLSSTAYTLTCKGPVVLGADSTIKTDGSADGAVSFTATINDDSDSTTRDLTVTAGTGSITCSGIIGGSAAIDALSLTGGAINLYGVGGSSSSGASTLTATASDALSLYGSSYYTSGAQTFTATENGVRYLGTNAGTWYAGGTGITLSSTDVYFDHTGVTLTLGCSLSCQNFYFYRGTLLLSSGTVATSKDFVVWGSGYSADDPRYTDSDTRFAYYGTDSIHYYPAGGTYSGGAFSTTPTSAFSSSSSGTITVGADFYNNGAAMSVSAVSLKLPANNSSSPTFNSSSAVTASQWGTPYAVAFNMSVSNVTTSCYSSSGSAYVAAGSYAYDGTTVGTDVVAQCVTNSGSNTNWQFYFPQIVSAKTVYDDVLEVTFNIPLENSNGEINTIIASSSDAVTNGGMWYDNTNTAKKFAHAYADADCTTDALGDAPTVIYLRTTTTSGTNSSASTTWNTDATGSAAYTSTATVAADCTNRSGNHSTVIPNLSFLEGNVYASDGHSMCRNYGTGIEGGTAQSSSNTYASATDACAPVLVAVRTGQEMHTAPGGTASTADFSADAQQPYDSHNFIEFQYSEPVTVCGMSSTSGTLNKKVSAYDSSTASTGGEVSGTSGVTVSGFASTNAGSITAGEGGSTSKTVHALYRKFALSAGGTAAVQTNRVRVSIAGYVSGTVTNTDSKSYYNWAGYVSSAAVPSGAVTRAENVWIKDEAVYVNALAVSGTTTNHTLPSLTVNGTNGSTATDTSSATTLYGAWDVTPPSFAYFRKNGTETWNKPNSSVEYESVGAAYNGSASLNSIEMHMFDNEPKYTDADTYQWFSRIGWAACSDGNKYSSIKQNAADISGGARQFIGSNYTSGGIRYCTLYNLTAGKNFTYSLDGTSYLDFDTSKSVGGGALSSLFTPASGTGNATGSEDGCYFKLYLPSSTSYDSKTTFVVKFDAYSCHMTDLAGNCITGSYTMPTVDRTPPAFNMTVAPVGKTQMLIVFSKKLNVGTMKLYTVSGVYEEKNALEYMPTAVKLSGGNEIDTDVPAVCVFQTENATGLVFTLKNTTTLNEIGTVGGTEYFAVVQADSTYKYDPLSGTTAGVTAIQDDIGNYAVAGTQHAFSDFAVNAVLPQYAYDYGLYDADGNVLQQNVFSSGSWSVHDWNADQGNYGTLQTGYDIFLNARLYDGSSGNTGGLVTSGIDLYLDTDPQSNSISTKYNSVTGSSWRVWVPNYTPVVFTNLAPANNGSSSLITFTGGTLAASASTGDPQYMNFKLPVTTDSLYAGWTSGKQVKFLFRLGAYTVQHEADGTVYPLYALRLKNDSDLTSLDLWSFRLKSAVDQRGSVTILNNVINAGQGENTVVKVTMPSAGNLSVIVMTLDGDIVQYLQHGSASEGEHYYRWNGTTKSGRQVARGLYFIRVFGNGIDETRKVMVVKD